MAVVLAATAILLLYLVHNVYRLTQNIAKAKASGLPYVVLPVFVYTTFWLATHPIWLGLLNRVLPSSWRGLRLR